MTMLDDDEDDDDDDDCDDASDNARNTQRCKVTADDLRRRTQEDVSGCNAQGLELPLWNVDLFWGVDTPSWVVDTPSS